MARTVSRRRKRPGWRPRASRTYPGRIPRWPLDRVRPRRWGSLDRALLRGPTVSSGPRYGTTGTSYLEPAPPGRSRRHRSPRRRAGPVRRRLRSPRTVPGRGSAGAGCRRAGIMIDRAWTPPVAGRPGPRTGPTGRSACHHWHWLKAEPSSGSSSETAVGWAASTAAGPNDSHSGVRPPDAEPLSSVRVLGLATMVPLGGVLNGPLPANSSCRKDDLVLYVGVCGRPVK